MQDHGSLVTAVGVGIGQVELSRQAEVQLAGGEGVLSAYGGLDIHVQLGAVEGGLADLLCKFNAQVGQHLPEGGLGLIPHLVVIVILHLVGGVTKREDTAVVGNVEILVNLKDQVADRRHLALDLFRSDEQMGVVLAEVPGTLNALQCAAGLKPEVMGHLANADGELPIGVGPVGVDHHMMGAVHGAQHKALVLHLHGGEHVVLVVIPVTGGAVEVHRAHAGRQNVLIAQLPLLFLDIVLKDLPERIALGEEHGHSLAHQIMGHKEAQLPAQLPVIPHLRLFLLLQILVQLILFGEGDAVDALQGLPVGVAPPVGGVAGGQLDGIALDPAGGVQMGAGAEVGEFALLVEGDDLVLRQVVNKFHLVRLVLHQFQRFLPGQLEPLQLQLLFADLPHLRLDLGEHLAGKGKGSVHIIVKAVFDGRTNGQLDLRMQALDGLGQNVGAGVPVGAAVLLIFKGKLIVCHDDIPPQFRGEKIPPLTKSGVG